MLSPYPFPRREAPDIRPYRKPVAASPNHSARCRRFRYRLGADGILHTPF
jgi:hypothetical protein